MITAVNYLGTVNRVRDDIQDASNISSNLGTALDKLEDFLEVPGKLEDKLRVPESALDLPDAVIVPLSFAPGIGSAVKTIDRISEATSDEIKTQADAMQALDEAWKPLRTVVDVAQAANNVAGPALTGLSVEHKFRQDEALLLSTSLGNQTIYGGSQLAARMTEYTDVAEDWFATQQALLVPVRAASMALETAVAQLATLFDGLGFIDDALDEVNTVFAPIAKALSDLEDLLCVVAEVTPEIVVPPVVITPEIVVPPVIVLGQVIVPGFTIPAVITPGFTIPALVIDVCAILETIGQQTEIVISFVEGLVSDALSVIGVDLGGVADDLRDLLLAPLQPVLDALADLTSLVDPLIDTVSGLVDDLGASLDQIVEDLRDVVDLGSLFENREEGDAGGEAVDDTITGTDGEDALFGLEGADTLNGSGGIDFVFGGAADDVLSGDSGDDELYGGTGNDILRGGSNNDLLDGGRGRDTLDGGDGNDIVIGGGGFDLLIGGAGADSFVITPGAGLDLIADFTDDVDSLLIDAEMVAGAEAGDAPTAVNGLSFANTTFINLDGGFVLLAGVAFDDIVDDIVLV